MFQKNRYVIVLLVLLPGLLQAQRRRHGSADTLLLIKKYATLCNVYKTLPLQVELDVHNSCNVVLSPEDTMGLHARFYFQTQGSYIQYGELEQVVNDSLMVVVSNASRHIMVYANHQPVSRQLAGYLGVQLKDSSLQKLAQNYLVTDSARSSGTSLMQVTSRGFVAGTSLPREVVTLRYRQDAPQQVIQLRRSLVPVDSLTYTRLLDDPSNKLGLVKLEEGCFLVREQQTTYDYLKISHASSGSLPVQAEDRVERTADRRYVPVADYRDYLVHQNM